MWTSRVDRVSVWAYVCPMNLSVDFTTPGFDPNALVPVPAPSHTVWDLQAAEDAWLEDAMNYPDDGYWDSWSAAEQGMYDDDPSPYAGDYSEM
jgi:hypothetical protein